MSRSYKKHPYVKYSDTEMKCIASRQFRRIIRQRLKPWRYRYEKYDHCYWSCYYCNINAEEFRTKGCYCLMPTPEPVLPHPFEVMDPYDVCDAKSNPYKRYYRGDPVVDRRK